MHGKLLPCHVHYNESNSEVTVSYDSGRVYSLKEISLSPKSISTSSRITSSEVKDDEGDLQLSEKEWRQAEYLAIKKFVSLGHYPDHYYEE